jgi:hypothetical protein
MMVYVVRIIKFRLLLNRTICCLHVSGTLKSCTADVADTLREDSGVDVADWGSSGDIGSSEDPSCCSGIVFEISVSCGSDDERVGCLGFGGSSFGRSGGFGGSGNDGGGSSNGWSTTRLKYSNQISKHDYMHLKLNKKKAKK